MRTRIRSCLCAALIALSFAQPAGAQQQAPDFIRGRVIGPDSQPIPNVVVRTISFNGGIEKNTKTDKNGRFSITYPNPEGDYMVFFNAIGFLPRQFEVKRIAEEAILIADTKLQSVAATLATVNVTTQAARVPPNRAVGGGADISGQERFVGANVVGDLAGNLAAMAATIPGIQLIPGVDGNPDLASLLGIDPSQNGTTLNGVPTNLTGIPTDFGGGVSFRPGSADPSVGGFSGLQTSINSGSGSNYTARRLSSQFTAPQLQWTDAVGQSTENTLLNLGGTSSGPIRMNKAFYWGSYSISRSLRDQLSLLSSPSLTLQNAGVSPDSAERFTDVLRGTSIPLNAGVPTDATSDNANIITSIDFSPRAATSGHAFKFTANGQWAGNEPTGLSMMSMPSFAGKNTRTSGGLQLRHTNYFGPGILTQTSVSAQASRNSTDPFLMLPGGTVRVASELPDGSTTQRTLAFGGNTSSLNEQSTTLFSVQNSLYYVTPGNKHQIRLYSELRQEGSESDSPPTLGTYSYQSLADLENNAPSSYSRRLTAQHSDGRSLNGAIALSDSWIPKPGIFQLQYTLRADAGRFFDRPDVNAKVEETFGVTNDFVPNRVYLSPRAAFQWTYGRATQIPLAQGFATGPRAILRGSVYVNQSTPGAGFLSGAISNTGLPGSTLTLSCIGEATPTPDWDAYRFNPGAVPTTCADGTEGTVFASTRPNVTLFDRDYRSARSVNSQLMWTGAILDNRFNASIAGVYSFQLNQPSSVDLNFDPTVRFALDNEGNRPVFAQASSIVPATGLIATRDARVSDEFGRVSSQKSDLRAEARQLTVGISPLNYNPSRFTYSLSYAYLHRIDQFRGFNSTVASPLDIHWGASANSRHSFNYNVSYNFGAAVTVGYSGTLATPARFTPMIIGDVNGDGSGGNDRAFVFDPATATDPDVAQGMQALLDRGSSGAVDCLRSQLNQLASRNSCSGPWSLTNQYVTIRLNAQKVWLPPRTSISFTIRNPLAAADLLLHGDNKLRGWGQAVSPDQSLLYVRGFDPATNRYKYEVNQRFGSTSLSQTTNRSPAVLSMSLQYDLGPPRDWQNFRMSLERGRGQPGTKMPESQLRSYSQSIVINPMARIMSAADTLRLSRKQADSIAMLSRSYTLYIDSLWTPTAKYMAQLGDKYDHGAAQERFVDVRNQAIDYLLKVVPNVKSLLTGGQRRMLPSYYAVYLDTRYLENLRNGATSIEGIRFF